MATITDKHKNALMKKIRKIDALIDEVYHWGDINPNAEWKLPNGSDVFALIDEARGAIYEIVEQETK